MSPFFMHLLNRRENMKLKAEWISYMRAYRLYVSESPQDTIAYEDDLEIAEQRAIEEGYECLILTE